MAPTTMRAEGAGDYGGEVAQRCSNAAQESPGRLKIALVMPLQMMSSPAPGVPAIWLPQAARRNAGGGIALSTFRRWTRTDHAILARHGFAHWGFRLIRHRLPDRCIGR